MGYFARGSWTNDEDRMLELLISTLGTQSWLQISDSMGTRTAKQCRERYHNFLKPDLIHTPITIDEAKTIVVMVAQHGRRWAMIAKCLEGRSDNAVKNWWYAYAHRQHRITRGVARLENERQALNNTTRITQTQPNETRTPQTIVSQQRPISSQGSITQPVHSDTAALRQYYNWLSDHTRVETNTPGLPSTDNQDRTTFSIPVVDPSTRVLPSIAGLNVQKSNRFDIELNAFSQRAHGPAF